MNEPTNEFPSSENPNVQVERVTGTERLGLLTNNSLEELVIHDLTDINARAELAAANNPRFDSQRKENAKLAQEAAQQAIQHIKELQGALKNPNEIHVDKRYGDPDKDFISLETARKDDSPISEQIGQIKSPVKGKQADTEKLSLPTTEAELKFMLQLARIEGAKIGANTIINEAAQEVMLAENYSDMEEPGNPLSADIVREGFYAAAKASRRLGEWNRAFRENRVDLAPNPLTGSQMLRIVPPPQTATPNSTPKP